MWLLVGVVLCVAELRWVRRDGASEGCGGSQEYMRLGAMAAMKRRRRVHLGLDHGLGLLRRGG